MLYVSSKNEEGLYGVKDTDDSTEEFFEKDDLIKLVELELVEIDGVDVYSTNKNVCIVVPIEDTIRRFKQGKVHLALSTMSLFGSTVSVKFSKRIEADEMVFVHRDVINVRRTGINSFSYDKGNSKSYRSWLDLDDILMVFESMADWNLVDATIEK